MEINIWITVNKTAYDKLSREVKMSNFADDHIRGSDDNGDLVVGFHLGGESPHAETLLNDVLTVARRLRVPLDSMRSIGAWASDVDWLAHTKSQQISETPRVSLEITMNRHRETFAGLVLVCDEQFWSRGLAPYDALEEATACFGPKACEFVDLIRTQNQIHAAIDLTVNKHNLAAASSKMQKALRQTIRMLANL